MPAMIFPPAPNDGDEVTQPNGKTYRYNAAKARWEVVPANAAAGAVLQMVYATDPGSGTSTVNLDTLNIAPILFTPKSANSQILVSVQAQFTAIAGAGINNTGDFKIVETTSGNVLISESYQIEASTAAGGTGVQMFGSIITQVPSTGITQRAFELFGAALDSISVSALRMNWVITEIAP